MTVPGEVSFKVKRFILMQERFTVDQIARLTGLKRTSVETVVHRLVRDGFVVKGDEAVPSSGRGRRAYYYHLAPDLNKRLQLVDSVNAFQPHELPMPLKPLSAHYAAARELLDHLGRYRDTPDMEDQLATVERHLQLAAFEERVDEGEEGTEVVGAYILLQQARIEILKQHWARAESLLSQAMPVFQTYRMDDPLDQVEAMSSALGIERVLVEHREDPSLLDKIRHALDVGGAKTLPMVTTLRIVEAAIQLLTADVRDESILHLSRYVALLLDRREREEAAIQEAREAARTLPATRRSEPGSKVIPFGKRAASP